MREWVKDTVAVYSWLKQKGVYRQLAEIYVKSGWIERVGRGAFKRSGDRVDWRGAVYTLQTQLKMSVHPAGKTALQMHGYAHYVPANLKQSKVVLFGAQNERIPLWFNEYDWGLDVRCVMSGLFGEEKELGLTEYDTGNFLIKISSPERAALELCYEVFPEESFSELNEIMESLTTLRPGLVQELLEKCRSVKAKRLFMHFSEKHGHAWTGRINLTTINFGSGKRSFFKGGRYDDKYKIVVPE